MLMIKNCLISAVMLAAFALLAILLAACSDDSREAPGLNEPGVDVTVGACDASPRNQRSLANSIDTAMGNLSCGAGPFLQEMKDYGIRDGMGNHVQSLVYSGPFSDGSARVFYVRSDSSASANELFWNFIEPTTIDAAGGLIASNNNSAAREGAISMGSKHLSWLEWLPDWGAMSGSEEYQSGYLFVADQAHHEVSIYYYNANSGDLSKITTPSTRLTRSNGATISVVYIMMKFDTYWLAFGQPKTFEIWTAPVADLFPAGAGSLDPGAFSFLGEYSTSTGGTGCNFVTDNQGDTYRLCFVNSDDYNCSSSDNDNRLRATKVTVTESSFDIDDSPTYEVSLGGWGDSSSFCLPLCRGMRNPSFRASGTLYVDRSGGLNVYSLAFGGEGTSSCFDNTGTSNGKSQVCSEPPALEIPPY